MDLIIIILAFFAFFIQFFHFLLNDGSFLCRNLKKILFSPLDFCVRCAGFSRMAVSAGVNVSVRNADNNTEKAMVSANCWYKRPLTPGIKATGTNTAARIRAIAITGPCTSDIALNVASLGDIRFASI